MAKNKIQVENTIQNNEWKTLHIFGYGETRLVTELNVQNENVQDVNVDNENVKKVNFFNGRNYKISEKNVNTSTLTNAQALIDSVYSKKPIDSNAGLLFHAITIVRNTHCIYVPKNNVENHYVVKYNEIDALLIQNLVDELQLITEEK
jgi:hypothetical protein